MDIKYGLRKTTAGLVLSSLVVLLAACGGGGGGGGGSAAAPAPAPASLAAGVFYKVPPVTNNFSDSLPFDSSAPNRLQILYPAADVGGSGKITDIYLYAAASAAASTCPNMTVKLGHTTLTALGTTFDSNYIGTPVTVVNNQSLTTSPVVGGSNIRITLQTPFDYNGVDNLIVDILQATKCSVSIPTQAQTGLATARRNYAWTATAATDTTGITQTEANLIQFAFAGGDNKAVFGTTANFWPFANTAVVGSEKPKVQHLYLAGEIRGSGPITGIAFQVNAVSAAGTYTYSLKFGHTSLAALTQTFASNITGSSATVANGVTFSVPAGVPVGQWVWIPIPDGVFTYNGTDNLVVEMATTSGTADLRFNFGAIANRRLAVNDTTGSATTGTLSAVANNIALRFHGGSVMFMPTGTDTSDNYPFATGAAGSSKRQYLYASTELGTGGNITSVSCRLDNATAGSTVATNYANFQVVLGHTTSSTLGATFASNMTGATTVFSGTYALPAGLKAGDWIEIPLSTAFTYDPTKNLVVEMSGDGAANNYNCDIKGPDAAWFFNRHASAGSRTATTAAANNSFQSPIKLSISK